MSKDISFSLDDAFPSSMGYDCPLMPSYARDDDSDYPFLFADENIDELMALAEERRKQNQKRQQRLKRKMIKKNSMNATRRLYFEDTYLFELPATILQQAGDEKGSYVVLDQTIFYPQGGGQPSDQGIIKLGEQELAISQVRQVEDEIRHYLMSHSKENLVDRMVDCFVQAERRLLNARYHTAGHLLANIVEILYPSLKATKGHSFPKESYVELQNPESLSSLENEKISLGLQWALQFGFSITSFEIDSLSFEKQFHKLSYPIPENKKFRAVRIGEYAPIPCGGTHVADTAAAI